MIVFYRSNYAKSNFSLYMDDSPDVYITHGKDINSTYVSTICMARRRVPTGSTNLRNDRKFAGKYFTKQVK